MIEVSSIKVVVTSKDNKEVQLELTLDDARRLYNQLQKLFAVSPSCVPVVINPTVWPRVEPVRSIYSAGTPSNYFSAS